MRPVPADAVAMIRRFEGCKLESYQDVKGVWTIGFGNTSHAAPGLVIGQAQAEAWFQEDLTTVAGEIARVLNPKVIAQLTEEQYGALCSFGFNLGVRPKDHAIWSLINSGQLERVPARMLLYNKAVIRGKSVAVAGLSRRRRAEAAMWQDDGEDVVLSARLADIQPTPILTKRLSFSKRLWLGFTAAAAGSGQWLTDHAAMTGEWARQLQAIVAPQITYSAFLAKLSGGLAIVAVGAGAAVMVLQAKAHREGRS